VALFDCTPRLRSQAAHTTDSDERAAYKILADALAEPLRTIASNAGHSPPAVLAGMAELGSGHGLDALNGRLVHMQEAAILDPALVVKSAVFSAVSGAALALTLDTLVRHRQPEKAEVPGPMLPKAP
jgi:chaperonin GroEL